MWVAIVDVAAAVARVVVVSAYVPAFTTAKSRGLILPRLRVYHTPLALWVPLVRPREEPSNDDDVSLNTDMIRIDVESLSWYVFVHVGSVSTHLARYTSGPPCACLTNIHARTRQMKDCSQPVVADLFFIILVLWGAFFTLSLLLAVLETNFSEGKDGEVIVLSVLACHLGAVFSRGGDRHIAPTATCSLVCRPNVQVQSWPITSMASLNALRDKNCVRQFL